MTSGAPQPTGGGVPRVFAVPAVASPLPVRGALRTLEREVEVALRMAPPPDRVFPIRAPRNLFVSGMLFVLTCEGAHGGGRALVRVSSVADTTSVNFQLVMARVVRATEQPPDQAAGPSVALPMRAQIIDGEVEGIEFEAVLIDASETAVAFTTSADLRVDVMLQVLDAAQPGLNGAVLRIVRARQERTSTLYAATFEHALGGRSSSDPALARHGSRVARTSGEPSVPSGGRASLAIAGTATGVAVDGVPTISAETSVTIHSPVELGVSIRLTAPRGAIDVGTCFALRFYEGNGAKRSLVRVTSVRPEPGMLDAIDAVLLRPPAPAPEAASYRVRIDRFFTAEVLTEGGRLVTGRLLDLSAGGVGLLLGGAAVGDRLRFCTAGSGLPGLDGAEVVVVRRDPRNPQQFGARFTESERGRRALAAILDADRAERDRLREAKKEATRRGREIAAATMLESIGRTAGTGDGADAVDGADEPDSATRPARHDDPT